MFHDDNAILEEAEVAKHSIKKMKYTPYDEHRNNFNQDDDNAFCCSTALLGDYFASDKQG